MCACLSSTESSWQCSCEADSLFFSMKKDTITWMPGSAVSRIGCHDFLDDVVANVIKLRLELWSTQMTRLLVWDAMTERSCGFFSPRADPVAICFKILVFRHRASLYPLFAGTGGSWNQLVSSRSAKPRLMSVAILWARQTFVSP